MYRSCTQCCQGSRKHAKLHRVNWFILKDMVYQSCCPRQVLATSAADHLSTWSLQEVCQHSRVILIQSRIEFHVKVSWCRVHWVKTWRRAKEYLDLEFLLLLFTDWFSPSILQSCNSWVLDSMLINSIFQTNGRLGLLCSLNFFRGWSSFIQPHEA